MSDTTAVIVLLLIILIVVGPRLREELRWLRGEKLPRLEPWTPVEGEPTLGNAGPSGVCESGSGRTGSSPSTGARAKERA